MSNFATPAQVSHLLEMIRGATEERLKVLVDSGILTGLLEADLTRFNQNYLRRLLGSILTELTVQIDYGLTMEQMIADGCYNNVDCDINSKHFPLQGEGKVSHRVYLIDIGGDFYGPKVRTDDVIKKIDKQGKRPATIEALLDFGVKYPSFQQRFPVVALGSSAKIKGKGCCNVYRQVACLKSDIFFGRFLTLDYWDNDWYGNSRFLAFDK